MSDKPADHKDTNPYEDIIGESVSETIGNLFKWQRIPQLFETFAEGGRGDKILTMLASLGKEDPEAKTFLKILEFGSKALEKTLTYVPLGAIQAIRALKTEGLAQFRLKMKERFPKLKKALEANNHTPDAFIQKNISSFEEEAYINEIAVELLREKLLGPKGNSPAFGNLGTITSGKQEEVDAKNREIIFQAASFIEHKNTLGITSTEFQAFVICRVAYLKEKFKGKYPDNEIQEFVEYIIKSSLGPSPWPPPPATTIGADFSAGAISAEEVATKLLGKNIKKQEKQYFETSVEDLYPDRIKEREFRNKIIEIRSTELQDPFFLLSNNPSKITSPEIALALDKLYLDMEAGTIAPIPGATPDTMEDYYNQLITIIPDAGSLMYFFSQPTGIIDSKVENIIYDYNLKYNDPSTRKNILCGILLLNSSAIPTPLPITIKSIDDPTSNPLESLAALIQLGGPLNNTVDINPGNIPLVKEWIEGETDDLIKINLLREIEILRVNGAALLPDPVKILEVYKDPTNPLFIELQTYGLIKQYINTSGINLSTEAAFFHDYKNVIEYIQSEEQLNAFQKEETILNAKPKSALTPEEVIKLANLATDIAALTAKIATSGTPAVKAVDTKVKSFISTDIKTLLDTGIKEAITITDDKPARKKLLDKTILNKASKTREFVFGDSVNDINIVEIYSLLGLPFNAPVQDVEASFKILQKEIGQLEIIIATHTGLADALFSSLGYDEVQLLSRNGFIGWLKDPLTTAQLAKTSSARDHGWLKENRSFIGQFENLKSRLSKIVPVPTPPFIDTLLSLDNLSTVLLFTYASDKVGITKRKDTLKSWTSKIGIVATDPRIKEIYDTQLMFAESEATLGKPVSSSEKAKLSDPLKFEVEKAAFAKQREVIKKEIFVRKGIPQDENDALNIFLSTPIGFFSNKAA